MSVIGAKATLPTLSQSLAEQGRYTKAGPSWETQNFLTAPGLPDSFAAWDASVQPLLFLSSTEH